MTPELYAACKKSVHVLTRDGRVLRAGDASMYVLQSLGYRSAAIGRVAPFRWAVEAGYRVVEKNRPFFAKFMFRHQPEIEQTESPPKPRS